MIIYSFLNGVNILVEVSIHIRNSVHPDNQKVDREIDMDFTLFGRSKKGGRFSSIFNTQDIHTSYFRLCVTRQHRVCSIISINRLFEVYYN